MIRITPSFGSGEIASLQASSSVQNKPKPVTDPSKEIKSLPNVTPEYSVRTPLK